MRKTIFAFVVLMSSQPAIALDGSRLYAYCAAPLNSSDHTFCVGWVAGAVDGAKWGTYSALNRTSLSTDEKGSKAEASWLTFSLFRCWPSNMTNLQAAEIFAKYMRNNPEVRHTPAAEQLHYALNQAFPCTSN